MTDASVNGLILCSRYAFAPNRLHYCGPEKQTDMYAYVKHAAADSGLKEILKGFETVYPYLSLIASENRIVDPFDVRVVEAYWIGNRLLRHVRVGQFAGLLTDSLRLKRKIPVNMFQTTVSAVVAGVPHHNVHVMNVFVRTGHEAIVHTITTMDQCRISWGRVVGEEGSPVGDVRHWIVEVQPLTFGRDRLVLSAPEKRLVTSVGVVPGTGDWVSIHWGYVCDILTENQKQMLVRCTMLAIRLANSTV